MKKVISYNQVTLSVQKHKARHNLTAIERKLSLLNTGFHSKSFLNSTWHVRNIVSTRSKVIHNSLLSVLNVSSLVGTVGVLLSQGSNINFTEWLFTLNIASYMGLAHYNVNEIESAGYSKKWVDSSDHNSRRTELIPSVRKDTSLSTSLSIAVGVSESKEEVPTLTRKLSVINIERDVSILKEDVENLINDLFEESKKGIFAKVFWPLETFAWNMSLMLVSLGSIVSFSGMIINDELDNETAFLKTATFSNNAGLWH